MWGNRDARPEAGPRRAASYAIGLIDAMAANSPRSANGCYRRPTPRTWQPGRTCRATAAARRDHRVRPCDMAGRRPAMGSRSGAVGQGVRAVAEATGRRVIGIDSSPGMLEQARARAAGAGVELDLRECDMRDLALDEPAA